MSILHYTFTQDVQVDQTLPLGRNGNPQQMDHPKFGLTGLPGYMHTYVYIYIFIYICLTMSTCCDFLSMNRNKNKQCLAPAVFRCERKHAEEKINERKHQWTMKGDYKLHIRLSTKPLNKKKTRLWNFEFLANKNPAINQKLAKSWHDTGCKTFKNSSKMSRRYCVDEPWHCLKLRSSLVQFLEI